MNFRTPVELPAGLPEINHRQQLMMLGSCFATSIGNRLMEAKFACDVNPYGTLYNPLSIATALQEIMDGKIYQTKHLYQHNGCWHSPMHHGDFSSTSAEETAARINARIRQAHDELQRLDHLLITWGTAYVYEDHNTGEVVGNCHKLPESHFRRRKLEVEEIVTRSTDIINKLSYLRPGLKVTLTVSPIRHLRDGLHANQLSKSTLLLAADRLQTTCPRKVHYFPAYEIVLDELRDYRFFAADMTHPSDVAVEYVWQCFCQTCISRESRQLMDETASLRKALAHRPLQPQSEQYKRFIEQIASKTEQLSEKYPYLDFETEKELCRTRLNP